MVVQHRLIGIVLGHTHLERQGKHTDKGYSRYYISHTDTHLLKTNFDTIVAVSPWSLVATTRYT